jgi:hypothetical protein
MSKICKRCGVKHQNSAKKCVACGAEFNDAHIYAKRRRIIILAIFATVMIAAAINYAVYSSTSEAAVRRIMNACKKADVDTVVSYYPDFYLESDKVDTRRLLLDTEFLVKLLSKDLYTFYLEDPATPSERECKELIETLKYYGGEDFEEDKLSDIKMVWVNYRIDIRYFWPKRGTRFIVFKYEGQWYWWPNNVNR